MDSVGPGPRRQPGVVRARSHPGPAPPSRLRRVPDPRTDPTRVVPLTHGLGTAGVRLCQGELRGPYLQRLALVDGVITGVQDRPVRRLRQRPQPLRRQPARPTVDLHAIPEVVPDDRSTKQSVVELAIRSVLGREFAGPEGVLVAIAVPPSAQLGHGNQLLWAMKLEPNSRPSGTTPLTFARGFLVSRVRPPCQVMYGLSKLL